MQLAGERPRQATLITLLECPRRGKSEQHRWGGWEAAPAPWCCSREGQVAGGSIMICRPDPTPRTCTHTHALTALYGGAAASVDPGISRLASAATAGQVNAAAACLWACANNSRGTRTSHQEPGSYAFGPAGRAASPDARLPCTSPRELHPGTPACHHGYTVLPGAMAMPGYAWMQLKRLCVRVAPLDLLGCPSRSAAAPISSDTGLGTAATSTGSRALGNAVSRGTWTPAMLCMCGRAWPVRFPLQLGPGAALKARAAPAPMYNCRFFSSCDGSS